MALQELEIPPRPASTGVYGAVQHRRELPGGGAHRLRQDRLRRVRNPADAAEGADGTHWLATSAWLVSRQPR